MDASFKNLPTEWILLDSDRHIIATNVGRHTMNAAMTAHRRFYMAKCHYRTGENGREYYTGDDQIAELLERRIDSEYPYDAPIVGIKRYGVVK